MKGVDVYKTKAGFTVAKWHYSSDTAKDLFTDDGQAWLKGALAGVKGGMSSHAWRKEMEID